MFGSKPLHTLCWHVCVCVRMHYKFQSAHIPLANKHFIFYFAQNLVVSLHTGETCQGLHPMFVLAAYEKMFGLFYSACLFVLLGSP